MLKFCAYSNQPKSDLQMPSIGFIGGGNMAGSLIGGLIDAGFPAADILVAEPDEARQQVLRKQHNVNTCTDNKKTLASEIIVLAVKPQRLKIVCLELDTSDAADNLFISIAAGVRSTDISRWLSNGEQSNTHNNDLSIVRCMPNTPALIQCGASGLYANECVSSQQKRQAEDVLQAVGLVIWVEEEKQLDAVTAVSGSGPAYFFLMMEAMQNAGEELGLSTEVTRQLVLQTALGAARMAVESEFSTTELRQKVTSKGGTTEQAILSFQAADFQQIVSDALKAANDRSVSLADELGSK